MEYLDLMPDELLMSDEFQTAWEEWLQHRKEIRKRLTPLAAKKQLALLGRYSPDIAIEMINRSIINSWQGIFELPNNHPLMMKQTPILDPDQIDDDINPFH